METHPVGYASNIARVETWECDFNGHWNTRFYTRAFQEASETVALLDGRGSPGAASMRARHIRFHRELRTGDPVLVRSAAIQDGRWQGAVVHWLESDGVLSATALDLPGVDASGRASRHLPRVSEAAVAQALPRGLPHEAPLARAATAGGRRASLGILRPASYDHTGALMFDELFRYIGCATYDFHVSLGYSPQFLARTGISRMVVEMRVNWLGQAPAGALKENSRGSISAMVKPLTGQANFSEKVMRSGVGASGCADLPLTPLGCAESPSPARGEGKEG